MKKWIDSWLNSQALKSPFAKKKKESKKKYRANKKLKVRYSKDVPEDISNHYIYIIGENNFYWMAGLICPCGCGVFIQLNLLKEANPCWKFKITKDLISVYPSVRRTRGCKSHFYINKGKIIWAKL